MELLGYRSTCVLFFFLRIGFGKFSEGRDGQRPSGVEKKRKDASKLTIRIVRWISLVTSSYFKVSFVLLMQSTTRYRKDTCCKGAAQRGTTRRAAHQPKVSNQQRTEAEASSVTSMEGVQADWVLEADTLLSLTWHC